MATTKRLKRSTDDVMLAGVCAGIAEHLDQDPTLIRILAVVLTIFTGLVPGLLAYLIIAVIMPQD